MTREEAIHQLKNTSWIGTRIEEKKTKQAVDMAIEALRFQEVYDVTINAVSKYYDEHHAQILSWTPCSERLPDDGEEYLVTVQCDGHSIVDIDQCFSYGWDDYGADVIAWMPLPTPYQEDNQ